jgi:3-deoxy-manno-octulosonate cytidylyltransferase (CMP-KDO synthetase)
VQLRQRVKCVTDRNGYALYFSRGMLPHNKDGVPKPFPAPFQVQNCLLASPCSIQSVM